MNRHLNRHLTSVMAAVFATVLLAAPAFAHHRPGNVVVMGGTTSMTGRNVEPAGRQHNGVKLYVEELNARGGLLGHKVELRILDDKSHRRTAITLYEKLITEDRVDFVLAPYSSKLNDAVANVTERYRQPYLSQGSNPVIWQRGRKYVFGVPTLFGQNFQKGALRLAKKIGIKRIAIITGAELGARASSIASHARAKKLGLKVVLSERYREEQTDFIDLLQRIRSSGAEAIFSIGRFNDTVAQVRQLRELNINVKMFAAQIAPALPKFVEELGSLAEYVVGASKWEPKPALGHPGMKEFIENYERRYGVKPNYHAAQGYAAMQIMTAVVNRAGSFEPEKVREALASIAVYTVKGPYKANESGVSPSTEPLTFQIQRGERVIVWPEQVAEGKFIPMPKWEDRGKK